MSDALRDPVCRISYTFEPVGDDLVVHAVLEPRGGLPAHFHPRQTEHWSVEAGEAHFRLGDHERVLRAGEPAVEVAPNTVHAIHSTGAEARLRCLVVPAGDLQAFLEESVWAGERGLFTAKGRPRGLRGVRWAARFLKRHQDETVMVSPPRPVQRLLFAVFARD